MADDKIDPDACIDFTKEEATRDDSEIELGSKVFEPLDAAEFNRFFMTKDPGTVGGDISRHFPIPNNSVGVKIDISECVAILNEALALDPQAFTALVATRVPCNAALGDHPTIQVGWFPKDGWEPEPGSPNRPLCNHCRKPMKWVGFDQPKIMSGYYCEGCGTEDQSGDMELKVGLLGILNGIFNYSARSFRAIYAEYDESETSVCADCSGAGEVDVHVAIFSAKHTCHLCHGSGKIVRKSVIKRFGLMLATGDRVRFKGEMATVINPQNTDGLVVILVDGYGASNAVPRNELDVIERK